MFISVVQFFRFITVAVVIVSSGWFLPMHTWAAATITVVNRDGANEGLNDPTPFTPIGGNTATTVGEARLKAFEYAGSIWGDLLNSSVAITVDANVDPLGAGILAQAGPSTVHRNFSNTPVANTWYVQALANKFSGMDLAPSISDMSITFSSDFAFYFGLDGKPPVGQYDFVSVVLHEIGHGLGFLSLVNSATGEKFFGIDDVYSRHLEQHNALPADYSSMTNGGRVQASTSQPHLHFTGPETVGNSGQLTAGHDEESGHVQMYAPRNSSPGSSVSHFNKVIKPDQLMEHSISNGEAIHQIGLAGELLTDLGWEVNLEPTLIRPLVNATLNSSAVTFAWTAHNQPVTEWWLYVGSTQGGRDVYNSQALGEKTSLLVSGLPTDGRTLYVRLWYRVGGLWEFSDEQFTAATFAALSLTSPQPHSTLESSSVTLEWTSNGQAVDDWWVYLGSNPGASDLYSSGNLGDQTLASVSGLPTDGRAIYIRLWYRIGGLWNFIDEQLTAATLVDPGVISPLPFSILDGSEVLFRWSAHKQPVSSWWLYIGSTPGARDVYNSSDLGMNVEHVISGLPTDGRTLHVRLWYRIGGFWQFVDQQLTAASFVVPVVMDPIASSRLDDTNIIFQWTANELPVTNWWFFIGSSIGARDIYNSGDIGTNLSRHVKGLPTDGRTLHLRLWYRSGGVWQFVDVPYTAANL